jgi:VIT1/CCC1 family predicted Fe2+/Mn2+ transporter
MKATCPHCGQHTEAEDQWAGMNVSCPTCNEEFPLPAVEPTVVTANAPAQPIRHPRAISKWLIVLSASLISSAFLQYCRHRQLLLSSVGFAGLLGGALPSFAVAMLFAIFPKGYSGIVVGVVIVLAVTFLQWIGISVSR